MADARFRRLNRLLKAAEFRSVFQNPCKSADDSLTVLARRNRYGYPRLGLAITKQRIPWAVARNRIKRIIRNSFRHNRGLLGGLDVVVLVRNGARDRNGAELHDSLEKHWRNITNRCKHSSSA